MLARVLFTISCFLAVLGRFHLSSYLQPPPLLHSVTFPQAPIRSPRRIPPVPSPTNQVPSLNNGNVVPFRNGVTNFARVPPQFNASPVLGTDWTLPRDTFSSDVLKPPPPPVPTTHTTVPAVRPTVPAIRPTVRPSLDGWLTIPPPITRVPTSSKFTRPPLHNFHLVDRATQTIPNVATHGTIAGNHPVVDSSLLDVRSTKHAEVASSSLANFGKAFGATTYRPTTSSNYFLAQTSVNLPVVGVSTTELIGLTRLRPLPVRRPEFSKTASLASTSFPDVVGSGSSGVQQMVPFEFADRIIKPDASGNATLPDTISGSVFSSAPNSIHNESSKINAENYASGLKTISRLRNESSNDKKARLFSHSISSTYFLPVLPIDIFDYTENETDSNGTLINDNLLNEAIIDRSLASTLTLSDIIQERFARKTDDFSKSFPKRKKKSQKRKTNPEVPKSSYQRFRFTTTEKSVTFSTENKEDFRSALHKKLNENKLVVTPGVKDKTTSASRKSSSLKSRSHREKKRPVRLTVPELFKKNSNYSILVYTTSTSTSPQESTRQPQVKQRGSFGERNVGSTNASVISFSVESSVTVSSPFSALKHGAQGLEVTTRSSGCPKLYGDVELWCDVVHGKEIDKRTMMLTWKKKSFEEGKLQEKLVSENSILKMREPRFLVSFNNGTSSLVIRGFQPNDCGTYECQVTSAGAVASSQLMLFTCH